MYKKLMFLISFVCLLVLAGSVRAAELEVPEGTTTIISDEQTVEDFKVEGTLIIQGPDGHLIALGEDERSDLDGNGGDGEGGPLHAEIIIDGGQLTMNARFNIGTDHDGYLIINNGGSFTQTGTGKDGGDGIKFPDNEGGEHRIIINDGTLHAYCIEQKHDRDAQFVMGLNGEMFVEWTTEPGEDPGEDDYDPEKWLENGDLLPGPGCIGPFVEPWGDQGARIYTMALPPEAWGPDPEDGEDEIKVGVVCTWKAGDMGDPHVGDKHYLYFGTSYDEVEAAGLTDPPRCSGFKPVGMEELDPDVDCACTLVLWTNYYWRIDEKPFGGTTAKGNVWVFTTGCEMMPGDINLDCVVDGKDYAMLADDWMNVSFFPDDF